MLKVGIVGLRNAEIYMKALEQIPAFTFSGIYDPSLLVDRHRHNGFNVFQSFTEVCDQCQAVIFSIDDNLYMPLMAEAVRHSLDIYLDGVHNFELDELQSLMCLRDEAGTALVVGHPIIYSSLYHCLREHCHQPLDVQSTISRSGNGNLMSMAHAEVSMLLALLRTNVHRAAVNVYSSFSSVPDSLRVRLDFDNGTVGTIIIDKYGISATHEVKVLSYNSMAKADFLGGTISTISNIEPDKPTLIKADDESKNLAVRQLNAFFAILMGGDCLVNTIENEIRTQIACEQIRAKMRINFNVF